MLCGGHLAMPEAPKILGMQQLSRVAGEQGQCYEAYVAKEEAREKYLQNFYLAGWFDGSIVSRWNRHRRQKWLDVGTGFCRRHELCRLLVQ